MRRFNRLTAGSQAPDGIVQEGSQTYPNTPGTFVPVNDNLVQRPVSHIAVQRSAEVSGRLQDYFDCLGVQRR